MPEVHDVAVLGAGPAGTSFCIEHLQRRPGASVLLLEGIKRSNTLDPAQPGAGHSMCSGGFGGKLMLEMVGWDIPRSVVMSDIRRGVVRTPGARFEFGPDILQMDGNLGVVTNRKRFDDWLLGWARKEGADYRSDTRITEVRRSNGHWELRSKKGDTFRARFLVGADGPESLVASTALAAPPVPERDMQVASEVYVPRDRFPADTVMFLFQSSRLNGYYWAFSAGDVVKVGCCTTKAQGANPSAETEWWRQRLADEYDDPAFLAKPLEYIGGRITAAPPLKRVSDSRAGVAVVGEAARAVWAEIAAGDASAVQTGRALGRFLAEDDVGGYQRWWRRASYGFLMRHYRAKQMLDGLRDDELDRILRLLGRFDPASGNIHTEVVRFALHCVRKEPRLMLKAVRKAAAA